MTKITDDMILSILEADYSKLHILMVMVTILIPILAIILFVMLKIKKQSHAILFALLPFSIFIFLIPTYVKCNTLKYSIDNKCWTMATDTVIKTDSRYGEMDRRGHRDTYYYVYLENNGKINMGRDYFLLKR